MCQYQSDVPVVVLVAAGEEHGALATNVGATTAASAMPVVSARAARVSATATAFVGAASTATKTTFAVAAHAGVAADEIVALRFSADIFLVAVAVAVRFPARARAATSRAVLAGPPAGAAGAAGVPGGAGFAAVFVCPPVTAPVISVGPAPGRPLRMQCVINIARVSHTVDR